MQDLHTLMFILWQRLWLVITTTFLGAILTLWGMTQMGMFPNYSATAIVAIGGDVYYSTQEAAYLEMADAMIENYRRLATLEIVTSAVVENLDLTVSPKEVAKLLDVSLIENSHLLAIKATHHQPETAAAIANEVAGQLMRLAPPQERNFVLIVETAVSPKTPDVTAVIPVMMVAIAVFLTTIGGLLFHAYVRQPILSEADLSHLGVPALATIDASNKDKAAMWWFVKNSCEDYWETKQDKTHDSGGPRHLLLTAPIQSPDVPIAAERLAEVWQLDNTDGVVEVVEVTADSEGLPVEHKKGKRPFRAMAQAAAEAAWAAAEANQMTIFCAQLVDNAPPALMLAKRVDMILLLVPVAKSHMPQLREALTLLNNRHVGVVGIVLIQGQMASRWIRLSRFIEWIRVAPERRKGGSPRPVESHSVVEPGSTP